MHDKPTEARRAVHQAKRRPLAKNLIARLPAQLARLPDGSLSAKGIRTALDHRDGLVRYLDDGHIELDTNTVARRQAADEPTLIQALPKDTPRTMIVC